MSTPESTPRQLVTLGIGQSYASYTQQPLPPLPFGRRSADYSQLYSDSFGNFLRRLAIRFGLLSSSIWSAGTWFTIYSLYLNKTFISQKPVRVNFLVYANLVFYPSFPALWMRLPETEQILVRLAALPHALWWVGVCYMYSVGQ
jgi:hypothetical protein